MGGKSQNKKQGGFPAESALAQHNRAEAAPGLGAGMVQHRDRVQPAPHHQLQHPCATFTVSGCSMELTSEV